MSIAAPDDKVVLDCDCGTYHHQMVAKIWRWDDRPEFVIHTQLHQWQRWYKRLWVALRWVVGKETPYGHWDTTNLAAEEARVLRDLLTKFIDEVAP